MRVSVGGLLVFLLLPPRPALPGETDPALLMSRLKTAWESRDAAAYLSLWSFKSPEEEAGERIFALRLADWQETRVLFDRLGSLPANTTAVRVNVQSFSLSEPRGREDEWSFRLEKGAQGWTIVERESLGAIDGLNHVSMDPHGFRAGGLSMKLEDFELRMKDGTLFMNEAALGPTLLVFVGRGTVKVSPRPPTEKLALRKYCGSPEMVEDVNVAFIRIHPADFHRMLSPGELEPDPQSGSRLKTAREFYLAQVAHSFVLDADVPHSPWWVFPSPGDALVSFHTARRGTLTFTVFASEAEGVSLFDRGKRRQICLYPAGGRDTHYNEDDSRAADVLSHDIQATFDLDHEAIEAEDTLRIRLLVASHTLHLRLAEALQVRSITSKEGGKHLFFRVRDQETLMVSLGALSGMTGEISVTIRYGGTVKGGPIDPEAQTVRGVGPLDRDEQQIPLEQVLVLTSRSPWYPQASADDYTLATLRFSLPLGALAVTGGALVSQHVEGGRTILEYRQDRPAKYLAAVVGRLQEGPQRAGAVTLRSFGVPRLRHELGVTLDRTTEILQFYAKEFGPCPYSDLNIVVVESENGGGHSPPGMVILARRPSFLKGSLRDDPGNFSDIPTFFLAHELAHQWWGHGVAGENYHERWLSEGLAQYAAALWVREKYGEPEFQGVLRRLTRWALKSNDEGPISLGHRLTQVSGDPQVFRAVVYDKGAYVLFMLRALVGEEGLRRALVSLQEHSRFQKIGTADVLKTVLETTGRDLSPYLQQWVFETRLTTLSVSRKTEHAGSSYHTTVTLRGKDIPGPLPLEVSLFTAGRRVDTRLLVSDIGASWTVDTSDAPKKVTVNEDRAMLLRVLSWEGS
jgi:hypothetical protein